MARPKQTADGQSARERIETAFVRLLDERPYEEITIRMLSEEAQVNHNSIYYHFESIEDIAKTTLRDRVNDEAARQLWNALLEFDEKEEIPFQVLMPSWHILSIYANTKSPVLIRIMKDTLIGNWLKNLGIGWGDLALTQQMTLSFIAVGLIDLMGNVPAVNDRNAVKAFMETELVKGIRREIRETNNTCALSASAHVNQWN